MEWLGLVAPLISYKDSMYLDIKDMCMDFMLRMCMEKTSQEWHPNVLITDTKKE